MQHPDGINDLLRERGPIGQHHALAERVQARPRVPDVVRVSSTRHMPKSRGRRPRGGDKKAVRRSPRRLRRSDLMLRDARQITGLADPLRAEVWASDWLGQAWLNAPMGEREAEHQLCMEVSVRACATPSPHGLAAVAALARVAPAADIKMLAETIDILSETQPPPPWHAAEPDWTPAAAWRAVDVQDAFDDRTAWGPAKEIAAALAERGIDLTDQQAVEEAIHALNAERLARRLTE